MDAYPARAAKLMELLTSGLQSDDGGWPHKLDLRGAATSLVSTAHVIEILRTWEHEYDSEQIQAGLEYLAREVKRHTRPVKVRGSGRGEWTRFPVFALWGLTRFHRAIAEPRFQDGVTFGIRWLDENALPEGGWAVDKTGRDLSFAMTTPAVHALDRLNLHRRHGEMARRLAEDARAALENRAHDTGSSAWWTPYGDGADPSAAATIMAVLALTNGTAQQQELARGGSRWLMANTDRWVRSIEPDRQLDNRQWSIMSFSLGLRAVVHPRIGVKPTDPRLRPAIEHLSGLWVRQGVGWTEFRGWRPTTTGCFAVVTAVHALKRVSQFDPERDLLGLIPGKNPLPPPARSPLTLTLISARKHVLIDKATGERLVSCAIQGAAQWRVLVAIARRHASSEDDQLAQSLTVDELATDGAIQPESVARTIRRLNAKLTTEAASNGEFLQGLIEHIVPRDTTENRYGFEQVDVAIDP